MNHDTSIHHVHDQFFKTIMRRKNIAKDFFQFYLPSKINELIDFTSLRLMPNSFLPKNGPEIFADIIYQAKLHNQNCYLTLLVEHQSSQDKLMPVRILNYTNNIIQAHLKNTKAKEIPFVLPMVVYHGKSSYKYSRDINHLVQAPKQLVDDFFLKPFQLIDLTQIENQTLRDKTWLSVCLLALKNIFSKQPHDMKEFASGFSEAYQENADKDLSTTVVRYIIDGSRVDKKDQFSDKVKQTLLTLPGDAAMTLADLFREEGYEKGLSCGISEGKEKTKIEIARNLLKAAQSYELIKQVTGLSLSTIEMLEANA